MATLFRNHLVKFAAWVKERPNIQVLDVNYNEMVADPSPIVAEIDRFLGGGLDTEADGPGRRARSLSQSRDLTSAEESLARRSRFPDAHDDRVNQRTSEPASGRGRWETMSQVGMPGVEDRQHSPHAGDRLVFQGDHAVVGTKVRAQVPRGRLKKQAEMSGPGLGRHIKRFGADDGNRILVFLQGRFPEFFRGPSSERRQAPVLTMGHRIFFQSSQAQRDQPLFERHALVDRRSFSGDVVGDARATERPLNQEKGLHVVRDESGILEREGERVTGAATVSDHDQFFRAKSGELLKLAANRRRVSLDGLVRAGINVVDCLARALRSPGALSRFV